MTHEPELVATLVETAKLLAVEAGTLIIEGRSAAAVTATKSSAVDIVTQMDLAAEALLRERIAQWRPHDGILGEEGNDVSGTSGITWVIDPIDGTVNYLYGLPHFGVSVAAVAGPATTSQWTTLAGAVFDGSGRLWWAGRGQGAHRDGAPLKRADGPPLSRSLVGTGFQYIAERRAVQGQVVAAVLPQVRDIRRLGAAAVDLCLVAAGELDAYFEHGLNAWDIAAGALIASEAGVTVAGANGEPAGENLTIAATPNVWDDLHNLLATADVLKIFDAQ